MNLHVSRSAFELGIVCPQACLIGPVDPLVPNSSALEREIEAVERLLQDPSQLLANQETQGYRELFRAMGHEELRPAGERLVESFAASGFKRYNNIIDAYNVVAIRHAAGLGLHDASNIAGDIFVDRATGSEEIVPLFKDVRKPLKPGDLFYSVGRDVLAWLGKRDVDSDHFKVSQATFKVLLVVLGNSRTSKSDTRGICIEALKTFQLTNPDSQAEFCTIVSS